MKRFLNHLKKYINFIQVNEDIIRFAENGVILKESELFKNELVLPLSESNEIPVWVS